MRRNERYKRSKFDVGLGARGGNSRTARRQHFPNPLNTSTASLSPTIFPSVLLAANLLSSLDIFLCTTFLLPNNPTPARKQLAHGRQIKESSNLFSCMTRTNPAKGLKRHLWFRGTYWYKGEDCNTT